MNNQQKTLDVRFLDDTPLSKDELKLHGNIAKTIEKIIELTKDKNKKVIGLFGSWGSGKSTVIEILKGCKDRNTGKEKYRVFVFDSWSHTGDFLKRAFLVELARYLEVLEKPINENDKIKLILKDKDNKNLKVKDILTKKIVSKIVSIDRKSSFEGWVRFLSIVLILSIVVIAFSNILKGIYLLFSPFIWLKDFLNTYGLVFSLILIAILILIVPIKILQHKGQIIEGIEKFIDFYILKNAEIDESHTTKEDLEFTNYDYENYLEYILKKAQINKEFIIVFDNLDRVDDETVLNTLSLIQLTNEIIEKIGFKNIYFLIPIDKERLEKTVRTIIAGNSNNEPEKEKFAKDFLEKIFPYKVNIPYIIHSEWRKFFNEKIKEAFGSIINDKDTFVIRMIFEKSINESEEKNLTPREIKNFINSLLENYLYWESFENKPDIRLQALYVALNNYFPIDFKNHVESIEKLLNKQNVQNKVSKIDYIIEIAKKYFNEDQIKKSLLKQYYKVDEIYTLFIDKTINAIRNENIKELKHIFDLLKEKEKVETLLGKVLEQEEAFKEDINLLLKLYKSLKVLGFYENFKEGIIADLEDLVKNIDLLSKLQDSQIDKFSEILNTNENIKELFIEKSSEIIITIPEEENNG
ncbi:P-loop NTPase fold protein [Persephonella sp.]